MSLSIETITAFFEKHRYLLSWLRLFYPKSKGIPLAYVLYFFFFQKILRINGSVPWPVHFTSRILYPKNITLGNQSAPGMTGSCYIQARNKIIIGHNVRFGPGVGLISSNHSIDDYDKHVKTDPITIGNNVWIGMNAVILPGVSIGDNVVIGAGSVVSQDIPSNTIAAGNPCRPIKEKGAYKGEQYDTY
ncbi:MAG: DapH/DapD/GlmU-related protein [Pseudomonadota bacterium]